MKKYIYLFLMLSLPAYIAIGHDAWYYYTQEEITTDQLTQQITDMDPSLLKDAQEGFRFSALGWLMKKYTPGLHDAAYESVGKEPWETYIAPVLMQKTAFLFFGIAAFITLVIALVDLSKNGLPGRVPKSKGHDHAARAAGRTKKFTYKRR